MSESIQPRQCQCRISQELLQGREQGQETGLQD